MKTPAVEEFTQCTQDKAACSGRTFRVRLDTMQANEVLKRTLECKRSLHMADL
jgi:hypothetical protein